MTKLLVVTGSARKGRVADGVLAAVQKEASQIEGIELTVADLTALDLPFYNNELPPSAPDYSETNETVLAWSKLVSEADGVVLLMPEYNHTLSAIQKNAIDWLYKEWADKPVGVVTYGWYGGAHSLVTLKEIATVIKINLHDNPAQLYFTKDLDVEGNVLDETAVGEKIHTVLTALHPAS